MIRKVHPSWVEIEATVLDDGRNASILRVPDGGALIEIVLDLPTLGRLAAEADGIRQTAIAWG